MATENPYEDQKLYSEDEVVEILTGLLHVYWSQPWYSRWTWNKWRSALETAVSIFSGKKIREKFERDQILKDFEDI